MRKLAESRHGDVERFESESSAMRWWGAWLMLLRGGEPLRRELEVRRRRIDECEARIADLEIRLAEEQKKTAARRSGRRPTG